jgi:hypothetical protein
MRAERTATSAWSRGFVVGARWSALLLECRHKQTLQIFDDELPARAARQSVRAESVTYVSGMNCHPCVRNRPNEVGSSGPTSLAKRASSRLAVARLQWRARRRLDSCRERRAKRVGRSLQGGCLIPPWATSHGQSGHVRGHPDFRRRFVAVDPVPNGAKPNPHCAICRSPVAKTSCRRNDR